jgi:hypothetical protein
MAFPATEGNLVVEAWIGDEWVPVPLLQEQGVTVTAGRPNRSATANSATLVGLIKNESGDWDPQNPMGDYFDQVGEGTPLRCRWLADVADTFDNRTSTNTWNSSSSGHPWTNGADTNDYDVAAGKGTHAVGAAASSRQSYLPVTDALQAGQWRGGVTVLPSTAVAGGTVGFTIMVRGEDLSTYASMRVVISTAQAVTVGLYDAAGVALDGPTATTITHGGGAGYAWAVGFDGDTLRGKVWADTGTEPLAWQVEANDPDMAAIGWVGVMSTVGASNTNTKPVVYSWDNLELSTSEFFGTITRLDPSWDETGNYATTQLEAQGLLGQIQQGESPLRSALYREYTGGTVASRVVAYWPCEDQRGATSLASALPGGIPMELTGTPSIAAYSDFDSSAPVPTTSLDSRWTGRVAPYPDTGEIIVTALINIPSGTPAPSSVISFHNQGTAATWYVYYQGGTGDLSVSMFDRTGAAIDIGGGAGFNINDRPVLLTFRAINNAADCDWTLSTVPLGAAGSVGTISGTLTGHIIEMCEFVVINRDFNCSGISAGHLAVRLLETGVTELRTAARAHLGEAAGRRAQRLCGEEGIGFSWRGDLDMTAAMGPQRVDTLTNLLGECAEVDQATLTEDPAASALHLRTHGDIVNRDPTLALSYSSNHLVAPFRPANDRFGLTNDVTITRDGGSARRVTVTDGRKGTDRIGTYDTAATRGVYLDEQAEQLAGWLASRGTFTGDRFPQLTIQLERAVFTDSDDLRLAALGVRLDDVVTVDGAAGINRFDQIRALARGWEKRLNRFTHQVTFNCVPAIPWQTFEVEHADWGRVYSAGAELAVAVDADDTTLYPATTDGPMFTTDAADLPMPIRMSGELISVTDSDPVAVSFVAAGAAAHGDNASLAPALPAGWQQGDMLIGVAAIRSTAAFPSGATGGYDWLLATEGNLRLFWKIATASESAPTVSFAGGTAGDTTSAVMIALRGRWLDLSGSIVLAHVAAALNDSAQNVAYPGLGVRVPHCFILYVGWKQDDYTSAASPGTEIIEASSTTGNDQSLTLAYQIQTTATPIAAGAFTITGGAAAISRGAVFAIRCDTQQFTVTRFVNGVTKSHAAGTAIEPGVRTGWAYGGRD